MAEKKPITGTAAKEADRIAIQERGIDSLLLMENASRTVTDYIVSEYAKEAKILILSGVGNNGADGICIGKQLMDLGYCPELVIVGDIRKGSYEFFQQLSDYKRCKGGLHYFEKESMLSEIVVPDVLVDAIFGIGLKRDAEGLYKEIIEQAAAFSEKCIAVDVPSGINADNGELCGVALHANTTITFGRNKIGLIQGAGKEYAGTVQIREIGIPDEIYAALE